MLMHLAAYRHVYFVACNRMRSALPHAYLVGLEALDLFFCLSRHNMHGLSLCALGHNSGSDVCSSNECPGETVHLPRLV